MRWPTDYFYEGLRQADSWRSLRPWRFPVLASRRYEVAGYVLPDHFQMNVHHTSGRSGLRRFSAQGPCFDGAFAFDFDGAAGLKRIAALELLDYTARDL